MQAAVPVGEGAMAALLGALLVTQLGLSGASLVLVGVFVLWWALTTPGLIPPRVLPVRSTICSRRAPTSAR